MVLMTWFSVFVLVVGKYLRRLRQPNSNRMARILLPLSARSVLG
jgi:hypothetical protein